MVWDVCLVTTPPDKEAPSFLHGDDWKYGLRSSVDMKFTFFSFLMMSFLVLMEFAAGSSPSSLNLGGRVCGCYNFLEFVDRFIGLM